MSGKERIQLPRTVTSHFLLPPPLHTLRRGHCQLSSGGTAQKAQPLFRAVGETQARKNNRTHLKLNAPTPYRSWRAPTPSPKQKPHSPKPWEEHRPRPPHGTTPLLRCCSGRCRLPWVSPTPVVPGAQPRPFSAPQPTLSPHPLPAECQNAIRANYATTTSPGGLQSAHLSCAGFTPPLPPPGTAWGSSVRCALGLPALGTQHQAT